DRAAGDFVRVQGHVIKMTLRAGFDRLVEIGDGDGLGGDPDQTGGVGGLGGVIGRDDDLRVIRRRLITARAVRRLVPDLPVFHPAFAVLDDLAAVAAPSFEVVDGQRAALVLQVPLRVAGEDAA